MGKAEPWVPERPVDRALAERLVAECLPALAGYRVEPYAAGWDNTAFRLVAPADPSDAWILRVPHREVGAKLMATEIAVLPAIADRLPAPIPVPIHAAPDGGSTGHPWPFAAYRQLRGETLDRSGLPLEDRETLGEELGRFLRVLHDATDLAAMDAVPPDELRRITMGYRSRKLAELLATAEGIEPDEVPAIEAAIAAAATIPDYAGPGVLAHGDLYVRHVLADDAGRLGGVIDWGDLHRGDPAVDLTVAFSTLPPPARDRFFAAYGPLPADVAARSRFRALYYGVILADYGSKTDDAALVRAAADARMLALAE